MALVMIFSLFGVMPQVEMEASAAYENTWTNTGNQRRDIVEIAKTQIGYHEGSLEGTTNGSNNYTKYNVDLYKIDGSYNYMWCQSFVAWCAKQAGVPSSEIKRTAGTIDAMDFFKSKGTWKGRDYTPQSGDIIYFYSSSSNSGYHVGIVSDVSNGQINTIEGNYSNKVATHSVALFSSSIVGYGCPNYSEPVPNPPTWANISISKLKYAIGENVTFSFSSDTATAYNIGIHKNGEPYDILWGVTGNDYSYYLKEAGSYYAYVNAYNSSGNKDSQGIWFDVYGTAPNESVISIDKTKYTIGEDIIFNISSDTAT
ncbi:MAG: CHAP domain-containing protein, partial [Ruminococcus sp.]|nr:CHAP domain-containing protein [Ruminococcus sp.]